MHRGRGRPAGTRRALAGTAALVLGTALAVTAWAAPATAARVADPFSGATPYLNPDYVAEVQAQAQADNSTAEAAVANYQTAIWMDHIGAIAGDSTHRGLQDQLTNAASQASASHPVLAEVVVYDLPGRDCAALASNGELPATTAGLSQYESDFIDPIASIESDSSYSNLRIVNIIEPDSLPNEVTNQSVAACSTATPFYEQGIEYALNKLHAIDWTYNYVDIAHSAWLGWSSNFGPAVQEFAKVARATTAGFASIDGFISNTANYTPTTEPYMTATQTVGGQQVESANFYQYDPYIDELHYDQDMRTSLVGAGFSSGIGMLIDTSRNGWGGPNRPTGPSTSTDVNTFVNATKVDQRPFRGDWCNQENAGIGARPQDQPATGIQAFVWIKPPGESDGTYPAFSGAGDPHCDPNGTQTDGNNKTYATGSFPNSPAAGKWFAAEFKQLVANANPSLGGGSTGGGDTTPPSAPTNLAAGTPTTSSIPLTWSASTDNVGVTGYQVFRGSTLVGTVTTTSYTDTGLTANTSYSYTVKAVDAAGNVSAASNSVTARTASSGGGGDTTPPSAPANLAAGTPTTSTIPLTWSASTDNVGVTGYQVFRGSTQVATVTGTSYTDTGLTAGTSYSYTVKAVDAAGNVSAASNSVTATTATSGGSGGGGCTATYTNGDDWGNGFVANVVVTNTGTAATHSWTVTWTWSGNQTVTNMWNATSTQNGTSQTATSESYNGAIPAGGNTSFGFQASYSGSNPSPTLTCTAQ